MYLKWKQRLYQGRLNFAFSKQIWSLYKKLLTDTLSYIVHTIVTKLIKHKGFDVAHRQIVMGPLTTGFSCSKCEEPCAKFACHSNKRWLTGLIVSCEKKLLTASPRVHTFMRHWMAVDSTFLATVFTCTLRFSNRHFIVHSDFSKCFKVVFQSKGFEESGHSSFSCSETFPNRLGAKTKSSARLWRKAGDVIWPCCLQQWTALSLFLSA